MTADQPQPPNSPEEPQAEETQVTPDVPPALPEDMAAVESSALPDEPPPKPATASSQRSQRVSLGDIWNEIRPLFKLLTIKALKGTIGTLETLVDRLEAEPPPQPSVSPSVAQPETTARTPAESRPDSLQTLWQRTKVSWFGVLRQIRSRLPASLNQRLDDRALTGAIALVLVVILWTTTSIVSGKPTPTDVATAPEPIQPPAVVEVPPELTAPEAQQPIAEPPQPEATPTAPTPTAPLIEPSPSPPPPLLLTPEQKLIASIQDQVAEVSNRYAGNLIQSVAANFRSSRLTVNIAAGWYELSRSQQDKLANDLLKRAQELDFIKLELFDPDETLLARSPVVGSEMIILKRSNELPTG